MSLIEFLLDQNLDKNNFVANLTAWQVSKYDIQILNVTKVIYLNSKGQEFVMFNGNFKCKSNRLAKKMMNKFSSKNLIDLATKRNGDFELKDFYNVKGN